MKTYRKRKISLKTCKSAVSMGISAVIAAMNVSMAVPLSVQAAENVVINEVCTANTEIAASDGKKYDFVELYNPTDSAVSIGGYGLSDDPTIPMKYVFPSDAEIAPHGFYVVYCNVKAGSTVNGTSFGLSKNGETLILSDSSGTAIENIEIPPLADNSSYGRGADGNFGIFSEMTPNESNADSSFTVTVPEPVFSKGSGFYNSGFDLTLTAPDDCTIYYTLDGSDPTTASSKYEAPITVYDRTPDENVYSAITDISFAVNPPQFPVKKAMIVRAIAVDSDGNTSRIANNTYFIGYSDEGYEKNMRVISLVTDPDNLFDPKKGIYVDGEGGMAAFEDGPEEHMPNYFMSGKEWERPANITIFDNGTASYNADIGIRMRGGSSLLDVQKSFNLYARSEYGPRKMEYDFFGGRLKNKNGKVIDSFDSITLRNGGNDYMTKMRDRLNQELVADRSFGIQAQTECVLFIDGEFWGVYNITEKLDKDYISAHYKVDENNSYFVKNWDGDQDEMSNDIDEISVSLYDDSHDDELYDKAAKLLDMQSYMDYVATELIIANSDSGGNNYSYWRSKTVDPDNLYEDAKIRFLLFDTESGQNLYMDDTPETNLFERSIFVGGWIYSLFNKLMMDCPQFREDFVRTYFDLCNENFSAEKVLKRLDELKKMYAFPMAETIDRFDYFSFVDVNTPHLRNMECFEHEFGKLYEFWQVRDNIAKKQLTDYRGDKVSSEACKVTLKNNAGCGSVKFNTLSLDCADGDWQGTYPKGLPLTLKAVPAEGERFIGWDISGADISSGSRSSAEAVIIPNSSSVSVKAVYADEGVKGDVNSDGEFSVADLLLMQRWLLGEDVKLENWKAADLCGDGVLDTFDLCEMRKALIGKQEHEVVNVSNVNELFSAVSNAKAGDIIRVAAGQYNCGDKTLTAAAEGTSEAPIVIEAQDKNDPPVLKGAVPEHGYVMHITGDNWIVDGLALANSQKGIVLDNSDNTVIRNCELYDIGAEAIAIRDGSSYCTVKSCSIHDTGLVSPGYGEGVYIGSSKEKTEFDFKCDHNKVIGCTFRNVAAEHVDVKEYTTDTEICGCTFYGDGMTGENYAGSFLDLKGNDCYIHDNVGYRNGNPKIAAAFEVHEQVEGWGYHHIFKNNIVYMDQPYGAENTSRRMYVVDGWFSDFSVKDNLVDYGKGLVPAVGMEYYNSDKVTYID